MNEHEICKELVKWARLNERRYPCLKWLRHWPNEGRRNPWKAKEIGIMAGPSDYFLPVPTKHHHGLWLEIKAKGKRPTDKQLRWLEDMAKLGHCSEWRDNLSDAIFVLDGYCKLVRESLPTRQRLS